MRYAVSQPMFDALDAIARSTDTTAWRYRDAGLGTLRAMARRERRWVDLVWGTRLVRGRETRAVVKATMLRAGWTAYRDACKDRGVAPAPGTPAPAGPPADPWSLVAAVNRCRVEVAIPF